MRRWVAMLAVWAALLGGALPTFACMLNSSDNCCPSGSQYPCSGGSSSTLDSAEIACCNVAPALTRGHTASAARIRLEPSHAPHSPDPAAPLLWVLAAQAPQTARGILAPLALSHRDNESLTYLRTARLRL